MKNIDVIEKMPAEKFEAICEAGVDVVQEFSSILRKWKLTDDQAAGVLIIAAAGISSASGMTPGQLSVGIEHVAHMWHVRNVEGRRELYFDFVQIDSDEVTESLSVN